jgi:DNA transposition AAA+ family ATPase
VAPELLNSIDAEELKDLALRIHEYQVGKKLSDNALFKKFAGIGSTTTYKRILAAELKELNLEKQLANYRSVCALIEAIGEELEDAEELFADLLGPLELRRAFMETATQASLGRVIIVEGDTGTGKTKAAAILVQNVGGRFLWLEASVAWGDKPNALLGDLLRALGEKEMPASTNDRLRQVLHKLKASRVGVVIDEAHHLGPNCLNLVKTLINQTPGEFILCAMATLWNRLERAQYQEVKQLTGNRLAERIKLQLRESDVRKLIDRRLTGLNGEMKAAVAVCMDKAPQRGNLAFVRNVCRRAADAADKDPVTLEIFTAAVAAEVNRR